MSDQDDFMCDDDEDYDLVSYLFILYCKTKLNILLLGVFGRLKFRA